MKLAVFLVLQAIYGAFAAEDSVCLKNHTFMEISGDAVLSVFIDTDYGAECNVSSPKSIEEVATALFVVQNLNKQEYVPGVTLGLRLYDTCNDRISVYKQALLSAIEMDCSAHYDLGILAPQRYIEVLEPLRSLDVLPVNTYGPPNLSLPLIDVLVDFLSTRFASVDLLLSASRPVLDRFLNVSKEAGICVRSDKDLEPHGNSTDIVVVALGDYEDIASWLDNQPVFGDEDDKRIWIVLPLDSSHVDDLLPDGSFVIKPEHFEMDLGPDFESADLSQISSNTVLQSPHLLNIGKAILEIATLLQDLQSKSCPFASTGCVLPRFDSQERKSMSNVELYEALRVPAKSHSTRYVVFRKVEDTFIELTAYKIDATSARFRIIAEKEFPRLPRLCVKKLAKNCNKCSNFIIEEERNGDEEEERVGNLKPYVWVPIFLTIASCGTLACLVVLAFIVYRYFFEDILDGNPSLTILLILATVLMLQSIVPFCLEDKSFGPEHLNSRKIFVSSLAFGLAFSVMLTRALFLAFSAGGLFTSQHINGYLQGLMVFFMAGVEISISTMYFTLSTDDSARVMRSPTYIALLSYDIFLLALLFVVCCFIGHVQRNYREGMCFFGTAIGLLMCWAMWLTCFFLMSASKRDLIVCYGILGTACLIIIGVLVPRTYFMCAHFTRDKGFMGRFEPTDFGPDPRMNNTARQVIYNLDEVPYKHRRKLNILPNSVISVAAHPANKPRCRPVPIKGGITTSLHANRSDASIVEKALDLQTRQPFYEYVSAGSIPPPLPQQPQQQQQQAPLANFYGSASPCAGGGFGRYALRHRSPEPRRTPGYNNYGFRPEMRELEAAYVIPRLHVDDSDVSGIQQSPVVNSSAMDTGTTEARYTLPRSLLRKGRSERAARAAEEQRRRDELSCVPTEVYVQDRLSPNCRGPNEHYPQRSSTPKLSPTHATIREEDEIIERPVRITRF